MKYLAAIALTFTIISSPAVADECDDTAAKIAKSEHLIVATRHGDIISLDSDKYGYAIDLACSYPPALTSDSPPDPPQQWYNSVARAPLICSFSRRQSRRNAHTSALGE
jgi:hypothetical protein